MPGLRETLEAATPVRDRGFWFLLGMSAGVMLGACIVWLVPS